MAGIPLFEPGQRTVPPEEAFKDVTRDAVEYYGTTTTIGIGTLGSAA